MVKYIPELGDIVALTFDHQSGHEQLAIIISNKVFNQHLGLAFACPITNTKRDFPFHIEVDSKQLTGFIMVEQMKSIDYKSRKIIEIFLNNAEYQCSHDELACLVAQF